LDGSSTMMSPYRFSNSSSFSGLQIDFRSSPASEIMIPSKNLSFNIFELIIYIINIDYQYLMHLFQMMFHLKSNPEHCK